MPQIRKSSHKDTSFSVKPWQTKKDGTSSKVDQQYTEIQLPIKQAKIDSPTQSSTENKPAETARKNVRASAWKRKRQQQAASTEITEPPEQHGEEGLEPQLSSSSCDETNQDDSSTSTTDILGTATLALLPDGHISGHLVDTATHKCYGLTAQQLTSDRECTRDIEWKLLSVTILDFSADQKVSFPAERTAADAATIQAPLQMHGEEQQVMEALQGQCNTEIQFRFGCSVILDGSSAQACLTALNQKLCGTDAVINKGAVQACNLPFTLQPRKLSKTCTARPQEQLPDSDFDD